MDNSFFKNEHRWFNKQVKLKRPRVS